MITSYIIDLFFAIIKDILSWLPTGGFPTVVLTGLNNLYNSVYQFNAVLPVDTLFTLLQYTAYFWIAVWIWDIVKWFIHLFRGN